MEKVKKKMISKQERFYYQMLKFKVKCWELHALQ